MLQKQIYDCSTGQVILTDMTADEIAALPAPAIPQSVTRTQALLALLAAGVADPVAAINIAIASISDQTARMTAQIKAQADTWYYSDPLIGELLPLLGISLTQGQLFISAASF